MGYTLVKQDWEAVMQLDTGQWVVIGVCAVLIVGYAGGSYYNRRLAEQVLAWLKSGLGQWGQVTSGERLGGLATGGHLSVNAASEPFQRIEAVFLLEPRENLIFWLFDCLRGRQDELILKIVLRAAPGKESLIEAGLHRDRDFQQAIEKEKSPIMETAAHGLKIAHWGKKSRAGDHARPFLEQYGQSVTRLSIRRQSPHLFLRASLKPLLKRPAEDFFSALRDLIVE
ncbi:MAG: hypothetical protein MUO77_06275 [Anaerolineales bacterium]|nr:hypothetical protein [Anaerolineales bacterium]